MLVLKIIAKLALGIVLFFALVEIIRSYWLSQVPSAIWSLLLAFWIAAFLEVWWLRHKKEPLPRLFSHLWIAPLAILLSFNAATGLTFLFAAATEQKAENYYEAINIEHSKHKIRAYIYGNTPPEQKVTFYLYNDVWGCLNGMVAREAELYNETAPEGLTSSNAAVRARSLRASIQVYDSLQGGDISFLQTVKLLASEDEDLIVRQIAAKFLNDMRKP